MEALPLTCHPATPCTYVSSVTARVDRLSSHGMRHTYAVAMLSGTWGYEPKSLEFVSDQLGHAELQTTQRYYAAYESETWGNRNRSTYGSANYDPPLGEDRAGAPRPVTLVNLT